MVRVEGRIGYSLAECRNKHFGTINKNYSVGVDIFSRQGIWIEVLQETEIKHVHRNYRIKNCSVEGALEITSPRHYEFTEN